MTKKKTAHQKVLASLCRFLFYFQKEEKINNKFQMKSKIF